MKILTSITGLLFAALFILSCEKDNSNNKSGVVNPEKFSAVITGELKTEIVYDEDKIVAAGNFLSDYSGEYLSITGTDHDPFIVLNFYPPDDHPFSDDVISVQIKANAPKPWTRDKQYTTVYFAQLQYVEEYAIVSYWDESERRDYISYNRPESMSGKVKLWREGKLLKGEIRSLGLQSRDNRLIYLTLDFELRPGDDGLSD
ncbi:MAG TPA: hypothetical protein DF409_01815 [Bacteroidales bacterium]|jgi:hypothetical protein|nr:hypothetical protein [Bacteroidales bacterium]